MTAFTDELAARMRATVCAIGYLKMGAGLEPNLREPNFHVFGSGFVVRPGTILTTRRNVLGLRSEVDNKGIPRDRCRVLFEPRAENGWQQYVCPLSHFGWVQNYTQDIALLDYLAPPGAFAVPAVPIDFIEPFAVAVGQPVATAGYAFSAAALDWDSDAGKPYLYRVGPLVQQGFVSAISPYETSRKVDRLFLDLRSSPAMNGAPVVDLGTGLVIAVLFDTLERVSALAAPLDRPAVRSLLASHDSTRPTMTVAVQGPSDATPRGS